MKERWLTESDAQSVLKDVEEIHAAGILSLAGFGATSRKSTALRGDHSTFLKEEDAIDSAKYAGLPSLIDSIKGVGRDIAKDFPEFGLTGDLSIQVACYPAGGARYVRHLDTRAEDCRLGRKRRRITILYYLNHHVDGGSLRLFFGEKRSTDITPSFNKLVAFRSESVPHEVLPCMSHRYAVTVGFRDGPVHTSFSSL